MDKIKDTMSSVGASLGLTKDSSKGGNDSHDKSNQTAGTEPRTSSTANIHPSTMGPSSTQSTSNMGSNMSGNNMSSGGMKVSGMPGSSHTDNISGSHGSSGPSCCQSGCKCGADCNCGSNCSCGSCAANNKSNKASSQAANASTVNKALSGQKDTHDKVTSAGGSTSKSS